jgi:hypothetical protein
MLNEKTLDIYFDQTILSLLVMYKTWENESFRAIVNSMINKIERYTLPDKEETKTLESLCEHECIRLSVKNELKKLFN